MSRAREVRRSVVSLAVALLPVAFLLAAAIAARSVSAGGGPGGCGIEGPAADPPGFANCASCHMPVAVNSGDGAFRIEGLPAAWRPGTTYRLAGVLSDPGQRLWGFHFTLVDGTGTNAGTMAPADANTRLCTVGSRLYLSQTGPGRFPGSVGGPVRWEFDWTAPSAGSGRVAAYAVGIACNGDNGEEGDFTYTDAAAALEESAPGTGVTVLLQPDAASVARGDDFIARVRVTNHGASPRTVFLATRARLPSGMTYPRAGFFQDDPIRLDLAAGEEKTETIVHRIPAGAPSISFGYEALVGVMPRRLVARDAVTVTVL